MKNRHSFRLNSPASGVETIVRALILLGGFGFLKMPLSQLLLTAPRQPTDRAFPGRMGPFGRSFPLYLNDVTEDLIFLSDTGSVSFLNIKHNVRENHCKNRVKRKSFLNSEDIKSLYSERKPTKHDDYHHDILGSVSKIFKVARNIVEHYKGINIKLTRKGTTILISLSLKSYWTDCLTLFDVHY